MSKKVLFGNTIYQINTPSNGKIYSKIKKEYDPSLNRYKLKALNSKENYSNEVNADDFYNVVRQYSSDVVDEYIPTTFGKFNAVFSIGVGLGKNRKEIKIEKNHNGEYYQVKYISEAIRNKSQKQFEKNQRNVSLSRRNIEVKLNKNIDLSQIKMDNLCIDVLQHDKNENYKLQDKNSDKFITYVVLSSEQIDCYNKMISLMKNVNEQTQKLVNLFLKEAMKKKYRFSSEVLQRFLENKQSGLVEAWKELIKHVDESNLIFEAQRLVKREKREAFKYIFNCPVETLPKNINQIIFSLLKELNARTSHEISEDKEEWIKTNVNNDKHKTIFPTDVFIKEYFDNKDESWRLFEDVFAQFDLQKFIDDCVYQQYKMNALGNTKLFKEFNKHYRLIFEKEFNNEDRMNLQTTRTEMIRFIYRYLKGRVEKSVQTGQIKHWDVEQIKTKTHRAMQNKILERLLYLGKIEHGNLQANINKFQNFHAYEELANEFYVLYSFFNSSMMTFINEKEPDKKEFFGYIYNKFTKDKNYHIFSFKEIFKEERTYDIFKKGIQVLRDYSLHNNVNNLQVVLQNLKLQSEYQNLRCLIEKIQIQDSTKSSTLNLDIIFKGQNDKYKKIIKQVNSHVENHTGNGVATHVYPSISPFIKDLKQEFVLPKNMNDENKVVVEQALIYLLKTIYKTDICTGYFQIENIEEKYRIAQKKASQSQTTKTIKSFQKYIFNQFVAYVKKTYSNIFSFESNIDFKQEIENKTGFDSTFELKTLNFVPEINDDLDYIIIIMGLLSHPRITSQFANRCIATAEWVKDQPPGKIINYNKLIDTAENLKAILEIQGSWNSEELRLYPYLIDFSKKDNLDVSDIKYLPYELNDKQRIIDIGANCFSLNAKFKLSFKPKNYTGEKKNIKNNFDFTRNLNQKYQLERYEKYQEVLPKYREFVLNNKSQILKIQVDNMINSTYIQEDGETVVYHKSIVEALYLQTFDATNLLLNYLNLSPIKMLKEQSGLNNKDIEEVQNWLRLSRITGKKPIVKNLMIQTAQNDVAYNEKEELFHNYEMFHFRKNIITYTIHKQLNESITDIQAKWLQWIARFERDLHYVIKGLNKIYPGFIVSTKPDKSRPIFIDDGQLNNERMHYEINHNYNILTFLDKLGFTNAIGELKEEKEENIRNYIAHLTFLHKPFDRSIIEVTQKLSNLMNYRSAYNTAVEKSILNIFKREVEIPCVKNNKFINLNKIEKLIAPKQKTQFFIEDKTGRDKLIIELLKWKSNKQ